MTRLRQGWRPVVVAFLLLQPTVLGVAALRQLRSAPDELASVVAPNGSFVSARTASVKVPASLRQDVSNALKLLFPVGATGLITAIDIGPGDRVAHLSPVARIDGIPLLAAATETPFYRDLSVGDRGDDVSMLQQLLVDADLREDPPDGVFGVQTGREVRAFNKEREVAEPGPTFAASSVLWLPAEDLMVMKVEVEVGASVGAGTALFEARSFPAESILLDRSGNPLDFDGAVDIFVADGDEGQAAIGRAESSRVDSSLAAEILLGRGGAFGDGESSAKAGTDYTNIDVLVRAVGPVEQVVVPVGSVVRPNNADRQCLFLIGPAGYEGFATQVVGGEFGVVEIEPHPEVGTEILANPLEVLETIEC